MNIMRNEVKVNGKMRKNEDYGILRVLDIRVGDEYSDIELGYWNDYDMKGKSNYTGRWNMRTPNVFLLKMLLGKEKLLEGEDLAEEFLCSVFCRDIFFPKKIWKAIAKQSQKMIAGNRKGRELRYEAVVNGIREAINDIWCNELGGTMFPLNCTDVTALSFVSRLKYIALRLDTIIVDDMKSEIHFTLADLVSGTPMQPEFSKWVVNVRTKAIRKCFVEGKNYTAEQLCQSFLSTWIGKVFCVDIDTWQKMLSEHGIMTYNADGEGELAHIDLYRLLSDGKYEVHDMTAM